MAPVRRKKTAALLALMCLAALLCTDAVRGFHLLTARHVVCAAHGELVEADTVGPDAALDDGDVVGVLATGEADHHDHCSVAATPTRPLAAEIPGVAVTAVSLTDVSIAALPAPVDGHDRLVLAYAPKQGPPYGAASRRSQTLSS